MAAVDIQKTFDVTTDGARFASFIDGLRNDLRDQTKRPLFDGLNRLRPYTDVPQQWLRLTVRAPGWAVVLMLRMDNLYTIGFVAESQQWAPGSTWEFKPDPEADQNRHLINQSRFLRFNGSYNGSHGMGSLVGGIESVGWKPLLDAIKGLAAFQGNRAQGDDAVKGWLRTIVVTFSESIRSRDVSALIDGLLRDKKDSPLTTRQVALVKNWKKICLALYLSTVDPANHPEGQAYQQLKHDGISNNYQARQVLGIVYVGRT